MPDARNKRDYGRVDYGWAEARADLEQGVHPAVVAARLGEPEDYVREVAKDQGWPIAHVGVTAEQILAAHEKADA
jgi:hypothetical protein